MLCTPVVTDSVKTEAVLVTLSPQVRIFGNTVCFYFNGGWNYPGVEYVWKRINSEITFVDTDLESGFCNAELMRLIVFWDRVLPCHGSSLYHMYSFQSRRLIGVSQHGVLVVMVSVSMNGHNICQM